jgi:hypothetical protein
MRVAYRGGTRVQAQDQLLLRPWWRPLCIVPLLLLTALCVLLVLDGTSTFGTLKLVPYKAPRHDERARVSLLLFGLPPPEPPLATYDFTQGNALSTSHRNGSLPQGTAHAAVGTCDFEVWKDSDHVTQIGSRDGMGCRREVEGADAIDDRIDAWLASPNGELTVQWGHRYERVPYALLVVLLMFLGLVSLRRSIKLDPSTFAPGEVRAVIVEGWTLGRVLFERPVVLLRGNRKLPIGPRMPGHERAIQARDRIASVLMSEGNTLG